MASSGGVSACLIVRDEQVVLERCLASVAPFVDEIVVCDTGSVDGTVEIARRLASSVVSTSWTDDFAAARNVVAAACRTRWALSIDADEVLLGRPSWLAFMLGEVGDELDALSLVIDNDGDFDEPRRHRELRLFRPSVCRWSGRVHERLGLVAGGRPRQAELPDETLGLVHDGYRDREVALAKARRNAALAARDLAELQASGASSGSVAIAAFDLGRSLVTCGVLPAAVEALELAAASLDPTSADGLHMTPWIEHFLALAGHHAA